MPQIITVRHVKLSFCSLSRFVNPLEHGLLRFNWISLEIAEKPIFSLLFYLDDLYIWLAGFSRSFNFCRNLVRVGQVLDRDFVAAVPR